MELKVYKSFSYEFKIILKTFIYYVVKCIGVNNNNLNNAKLRKNDEFYTRMCYIDKCIAPRANYFENKIIYCNCDDPEKSNFYKFFKNNFETLKLKSLISTFYNPDGIAYKTIFNGGGGEASLKLNGNGDFRSEECVEILKECDVVVTNPPFSLLKEYIPLLMNWHKKFLIIAPMLSLTMKDTFSYFRDEKIDFYLEIEHPIDFDTPNNECKKFNNTYWVGNLFKINDDRKLNLTKAYNPSLYLELDNYKSIEINRLSHIPKNYYLPMAVPITYMLFHDKNQFKIIGISRKWDEKNIKDVFKYNTKQFDAILNGKRLFNRLIIQRKS